MHGLLLIADDDLLSRQVMQLLAMQTGYAAETFDSGAALLERLRTPLPAAARVAVLADMQMPGPCGDTLAALARTVLPEGATLLAMSGSPVDPALHRHYDGFLLKPFSPEELLAALDAPPRQATHPAEAPQPLNRTIFDSFAASLPRDAVEQLYTLCLDDADRRLETLRQAAAAQNHAAYLAAAHALKGGCGMVGAAEMASLAAAMERDGPPPVDDMGPLDEFAAASARLRRMLGALYPSLPRA